MIKFNIDSIDNPWGLSSVRAGVIKEAGMSIKTPLRVLNTKEILESRKIADSNLAVPVFPHPIFELTKYFKPCTIAGLTGGDAQASSALINSLQKILFQTGARFTIFHPVLGRNLTVDDEINKKLIALQMACDVDGISIIDEFNSSPEKFSKRLSKSLEQIDDVERPFEAIASIRMDTDERKFKGKLKTVKDYGIKVLNPIYGSIKENWDNYSTLIDISDECNFWVHMSELNRKIFRDCSLIHIMPLFGIDSFALNFRPPFLGKFERKAAIVKRFDSNTLGYLEPEKSGKNTDCKCFVDNNKPLKEVLELYHDSDMLSSAMTCHDTISSFYEFAKSREHILNKQYKDYLRGKSHMEVPMKKLFKIELAQEQLS